MKVPDIDVGKYLKMLTFLDIEEIKSIIKLHEETPEKYIAQKKLACEITELVHGGKTSIDKGTFFFLFDYPVTHN
jgi:tyrosyl-tRNA synthetase